MLYPAPRLGTRVKVRWDDTRLYVGAYIEETDLWGVITEDDKPSNFEHPLDTKHATFCVTLFLFNLLMKSIQFLECSWNHKYFGSLAKLT